MAAVPSPQRSLDELLARAGDMPVLPHVVFRLLESSGQDGHSFQDLERSVQMDPGFAVRLLRRANGSGRADDADILSIGEAIRAVGPATVIELASSSGSCFDAFIGKNDENSLRKRAWWRQSLDTATCCSIVAGHSGILFPDEAFSVGLLHNMGKTLLNRVDAEKCNRVYDLVRDGMCERSAEVQVFGWDHLQVGEGAAMRWGLPRVLCGAIDFETPSTDEKCGPMRACLAIGHAIAEHAITGSQASGPKLWALEILGFDANQFAELGESGRNALTQSE